MRSYRGDMSVKADKNVGKAQRIAQVMFLSIEHQKTAAVKKVDRG